MFRKEDENKFAEYWVKSTTTNGKILTIRKSKHGSPHICMTCRLIECEHIDAFKRQLNNTPEPWETLEGLTILGPL